LKFDRFTNIGKRLIYAYVRFNNQHERTLVYVTDGTHATSNEACNPQRSKHLQEITTLECKYYLNCYRKLPPLRRNAFFLPPTHSSRTYSNKYNGSRCDWSGGQKEKTPPSRKTVLWSTLT